METNIRAIDNVSIHRITSGQVVVDLATAVKELVENGLDAHATTIEVKFRNYGLDAIEVTDNGDGIAKNDQASIGLKHHTSKLRTFEELVLVETYGFRGEALSSLCALADVQIVTATKTEAPRATRLAMNSDGSVKSQTVTPGQKGTCVIVENIFKNLPVRRKDLEKNHKREFTRALTYLQAYAIICTNVRISVVNILPKGGKKSIMLASKGSASVLDNIINIYGITQKDTIMPIDLTIKLHSQSLIRQLLRPTDMTGQKSREIQLRLKGYISRPIFGQGRTASDRQLYFINARPCLLPQVARAVNETYRAFNSSQVPFVVMDLIIDTHNYDVNVAPDKRTILLHDEANLVIALKDELAAVFDSCGHSVPRNNTTTLTQTVKAKLTHTPPITRENSRITESPGTKERAQTRKSALSEEEEGEECEEEEEYDSDSVVIKVGASQLTETVSLKRRKLSDRAALSSRSSTSGGEGLSRLSDNFAHLAHGSSSSSLKSSQSVAMKEGCQSSNKIFIDEDIEDIEEDFVEDIEAIEEVVTQDLIEEELIEEVVDEELIEEVEQSSIEQPAHSCCSSDAEPAEPATQVYEPPVTPIKVSKPSIKPRTHNLETRINVSLDSIKAGYARITACQNTLVDKPTNNISRVAASDVTVDAALAEELLTLTIRKDDFFHMKVIGQFNLGFIIVSRYRKEFSSSYELFIVDQHASDEKFNFERLKRDTVMESQRLVIPRTLALTSLEELTVIQNMVVFEKNGFKIWVDETMAPGEKCKLVSLPMSKGVSFDEKDLHELIYLIDQHPGQEYIKCSKVQAMFAMRACRSSIMIGKPLKYQTMEQVVKNLGTLDKPWNCPHGRPTMRHLMNMKNFSGVVFDLP